MSEDSNIVININGQGHSQSFSQPINQPQPIVYHQQPINHPVQYQQQGVPVAGVAVQPYPTNSTDNIYWGLAAFCASVALFHSQIPTPGTAAASENFYQSPSNESSEFPVLEVPDTKPISPSIPRQKSQRTQINRNPPPPVPASPPAPTDSPPISSNVVDKKWSDKKSPAFVQKTVAIANRLKMSPNDLFAIMDFESAGINHRKVNPLSGATGLIQFMPSIARGLGTTTQALTNMSELEQLNYVERYLKPYTGRIKDLSDAYCSVLWPKCVGKSPDFVLFTRGNITYTQNNGFDKNKDGVITKREITALVKARR